MVNGSVQIIALWKWESGLISVSTTVEDSGDSFALHLQETRREKVDHFFAHFHPSLVRSNGA